MGIHDRYERWHEVGPFLSSQEANRHARVHYRGKRGHSYNYKVVQKATGWWIKVKEKYPIRYCGKRSYISIGTGARDAAATVADYHRDKREHPMNYEGHG